MPINVWRLAGDTLNITCNFLYCNHEVHRVDHPVISVVLLQEDVTFTGCRFYKIFRLVRSRYCRHCICVISDPERGVQFPTGQIFFCSPERSSFRFLARPSHLFSGGTPSPYPRGREADFLPSSAVVNNEVARESLPLSLRL